MGLPKLPPSASCSLPPSHRKTGHMKRRNFLGMLGGAAAAVALPFPTWTPEPIVPLAAPAKKLAKIGMAPVSDFSALTASLKRTYSNKYFPDIINQHSAFRTALNAECKRKRKGRKRRKAA